MWLDWARGAGGIHAGVVSYVSADPTVFDDARSNPRAWSYVSRLLHAAGTKPTRATLLEAVAGLVGPTRAAAFLRHLDRGDRPLTADDVLAYPRHRERLRAWAAAGRLDPLRASLHEVKKRLQAKRNYDEVRTNRTAWRNLALFLGDLPGDLREDAMAFFDERAYDRPHVRKGA
jgi:hypothetical protein